MDLRIFIYIQSVLDALYTTEYRPQNTRFLFQMGTSLSKCSSLEPKLKAYVTYLTRHPLSIMSAMNSAS